ncbi:ABC transporter ATP-binding protein [Sediminibacterium ginsengisoli]|uniref:ATP-binding cassette, subfamily B, MsbA n=1 Tax=Sediminibacterium ginsengisoli TaxID=413434 RepID=A0A1T4K627_9BACT|nr:ABC transporter ATP-binding protein [Sediminibacterium ginsengisoli]SJZ37765.1 ATP-binding cassette, subfamily B, MsbA [Sediminibacterium ginsengisoli]
MKRFSRILFYLRTQKRNILLYFIFNILSIVFSLVSLAMLAPFLQMLFGREQLIKVQPVFSFTADGMLNTLKYYLSRLISEYGDLYALGAICITIVLSIFFKNLFSYLSYRVLAPMRNYVMTKLRSDLYAKILELPIGFFTEQRKGDIISRMSNDANEVEWSVMSTLEGLIREPLTILIILTTLVLISPTLSLFLLVLLPLTGFIIGRVSRSLKKQSGAAQAEMGTLMSILDETLTGLRVIKAFNAEKIIGNKFFSTNNKLNHIRNRMNFRRDLASPMSEFLGVLVLSCILWFGGRLVLQNQAALEAGSFITYIVFFTQIINPAKSLSTAFYNAQRGSAAIQRIEEILSAPATITDKPDAREITSFNSSIEFRNVTFAYQDVTILKNINLKIEKGKTIALVGSSGAGKSTLADLVPRFHDVSEGELLIDGINIREYSLHSVRNLMGIVTQEPILFNDSIAANIALGISDATTAQIEHAASVANALNFIQQKEEGFETNIGDRGSKLSGGERQRVTIARAVLKNPPILILDEATSSLDTESERLVQDAINNMMQNRTSIVIAHRLSTIRHADEIVVLQKGEIAERGSHDELLALNGIYKKLVDMQEVK